MIDTVDVFYEFPNRYVYNACFQNVDALARQAGQALHKDKDKGFYFTTAFAANGILRIGFQKTQYHWICHVWLQPARFIYEGTNIRLAQASDFYDACQKVDEFFESINKRSGNTVLPPLRDWRVRRIDYAVNMETAYAAEYIRLFYAGAIPPWYMLLKRYENSFYLISEAGSINFYNKLQQLRDARGLTDEEISREFTDLPPGILRLEVQCQNRYIHHMKERYRLGDTTLPYLWNAEIAEREICSKVDAIIGKNDFYSYEECAKRLSLFYKWRTMTLCSEIIRLLRDHPKANLHKIKEMVSDAAKKQFAVLLCKIRKAGINPIPLDVVKDSDGKIPAYSLTNPYSEIHACIFHSRASCMEELL